MMTEIAAGILNLNKPSGMSSRRAVDCVARLVRPAKVGHAGTLDPLASGVLVVCIGKATRLIEFVQKMSKHYRATFLLGRTSPTEDIEGDVSELADAPLLTREEIEQACRRFVGTIEQRPPAFSALKIGGRRAYELARRGTAVDLKPRPVTIYDLHLVEFTYPTLVLDIRCSAGTYVRSLGRDLAESIGTGAVMSELVRTQIGSFRLENAIDPRQSRTIELEAAIQSPLAAVPDLVRLMLTEAEVCALGYGAFIDRRGSVELTTTEPLVVALDPGGKMVAVLKRRDDATLIPHINFVGKS